MSASPYSKNLKFLVVEGSRRARPNDSIDQRAIDQRCQFAGLTIQSRRFVGRVHSKFHSNDALGWTIFMVDKVHADRWDTDQRRQRIEAANCKDSMFNEVVQSSKSEYTRYEMAQSEFRWIRLSESTNTKP